MVKQDAVASAENAQLVYIVQRWNQIIGVYGSFESASQIVSASVAKGQVCDIIIKPVMP